MLPAAGEVLESLTPTIDASLGVDMVGGVKAIFLGLPTMTAVLLGISCGVSKAKHEKTVAELEEKRSRVTETKVAAQRETAARQSPGAIAMDVPALVRQVKSLKAMNKKRVAELNDAQVQNAALRKLLENLKFERRLRPAQPQPGNLIAVPIRKNHPDPEKKK
ncbi:MAG: hypothetical protein VYD34_01330 [Verrucomicrobiota bacterium]|nr:hypothetical protein [Verrucomicrobiota bacterium]